MSKKTCLHNPEKPNTQFRAIITKRNRARSSAIAAKLTPALQKAFYDYKSNGRALSAASASLFQAQLAEALEAALDGELDLDHLGCVYCEEAQKLNENHAKLQASGAVRAQLTPLNRMRVHRDVRSGSGRPSARARWSFMSPLPFVRVG